MVAIGNDWDELLKAEFSKPYYMALRQALKEEYQNYTVYPNMYDIFNALKATSCHDTKVVILGQDPYHNPGQAHGMSFSVQRGVPPPPSLVNIYKEQETEYGIVQPRDYGCLDPWAKQGVLLLNTVLTVRQSQPNSHKALGWQTFTDSVICALNEKPQPCVFLLWGNNAKAKQTLLTNPLHLILTAAHPSPLSAYNGFFGCEHFKKTNEFLEQKGLAPIEWKIVKPENG
ncbi:MAG: uracil-DNA glycosylase [Oscillospiraceae bacterium]